MRCSAAGDPGVSPARPSGGVMSVHMPEHTVNQAPAGRTSALAWALGLNGVFLVVINGSVKVNDQQLSKRDALGISDTDSFTITASEDAELLAIEVPMH